MTFGSIAAPFGLANGIIGQRHYAILPTAAVGSAVAPTLIAQTWFKPAVDPIEKDA